MDRVLDQFVLPDLRNLILKYDGVKIAMSESRRPPPSRRDFVRLTQHGYLPDTAYEPIIRREFGRLLAPDMVNPFSLWRQYYNYLLGMFRFPADILRVTVDPGVSVINVGQRSGGIFVDSIRINPEPLDDGTYIDFTGVKVVETKPYQIVVATDRGNNDIKIYVSYDVDRLWEDIILEPVTCPFIRDEGYAQLPFTLSLFTEISPRYFDQVTEVMLWVGYLTFRAIKVEITCDHFGWYEGQIFVVFQHLGVRYGLVFADFSNHPIADYWKYFGVNRIEEAHRFRHTEEQYFELISRLDYNRFNTKYMTLTCESLLHRSLSDEPIYEYISSRYSVHPMLIMRVREGIFF